MTVVESPLATTNNPVSPSHDKDTSDTQSQFSNDDNTTLATINPLDSLVQSLGFPGGRSLPPQFGQVSIDHSTDVHFGDKNIYQGPVTIKQVVYANGTPLVAIGETKKDSGGDDFEVGRNDGECRRDNADDGSKGRNCDSLPVPSTGGGIKKGYLWLQNVSNQRPLQVGIFIGGLILFLVVLALVIILKGPQGRKQALFDSSEQDELKPLDYKPDLSTASQLKNKLRIVTRIEWVAQPPINTTTPLVTPVPYVIIHHTATQNCSSIGTCVLHVRFIQNFHIESRGFFDIGYNFLVGGDGAAYEGRGWTVEGAHTLGYNARSIGIAFIGTFTKVKASEIQMLACKRLIEKGVKLGYIREDYKVFGARQLSGTESPGAALYEDIKTWPHWAPEP